MTALSAGFRASMRSMAASQTSSAEISRFLTSSARPRASHSEYPVNAAMVPLLKKLI